MSSTGTTARPSPNKPKILVWILLAAAVAAGIVGYLVIQGTTGSAAPQAAPAGGTAEVVRENSRVLSRAPDEKAVLVEFLDYECEACAAANPFVEELRAEYSENVSFVHRYFPLPGHLNSMNAAVAVEAAAAQGAYEPMYKRMFETQAQWGESAEDKSAVFRSYAEDLGLDMAAYDDAVADPATQERVEYDVADGIAVGVTGTPTFFLDGQMLVVQSLEEFGAAVAAAAAK